MKLFFTVLAIVGLSATVYADGGTAAMRLHAMSKDYDSINGGNDVFPRPLSTVALKFESPLERTGAYKDGHARLIKMSKDEARRIEALRQKLITMYVRTYSGCSLDKNSRWELIIVCDPDTGLMDGKDQIKEIPPDETINVASLRLTYPFVHGWYCLVDKKTKTAVLDKEITGSGAVIDTALDDFCRKLVMDFVDNIKAK